MKFTEDQIFLLRTIIRKLPNSEFTQSLFWLDHKITDVIATEIVDKNKKEVSIELTLKQKKFVDEILKKYPNQKSIEDFTISQFLLSNT